MTDTPRRARTRARNEWIEAQAALRAEHSWPTPSGPTGANTGQDSSALVGLLGPDPKGGAKGTHKSVATVPLIIVEVEGLPVAEPRPQFDSRTMRTYVPRKAHPWKREVRVALIVELIRLGLGGVVPVSGRAFGLGFLFRLPRPKAHWRTGRRAGELRPSAPSEHLGKPDLDNLIKAAKDAVGAWDGKPSLLWADDAQVTHYIGTPRKRYVEPGEVPGLTLVVAPC